MLQVWNAYGYKCFDLNISECHIRHPHSALNGYFETSILVEHSITIRYSITVSVYCRIDIHRRFLLCMELYYMIIHRLHNPNLCRAKKSQKSMEGGSFKRVR